jgi:hypothetical protein
MASGANTSNLIKRRTLSVLTFSISSAFSSVGSLRAKRSPRAGQCSDTGSLFQEPQHAA